MKAVRWVLLTLVLWGALHQTPPRPVAASAVTTSLHATRALLETLPLDLPANFAHMVRSATYTPSSATTKKASVKRFSLLDFSWKSADAALFVTSLRASYVPSLRERIGEVPSSPRDPPSLSRSHGSTTES